MTLKLNKKDCAESVETVGIKIISAIINLVFNYVGALIFYENIVFGLVPILEGGKIVWVVHSCR